MGLSWQQGPLGRNPNGQFLVPGMPERVLYAEPLRRRMRAELGGRTVVAERRRGPALRARAATRSRTSRSRDFADGALGRPSTAPSTPTSARPRGSRSSAATRSAARGAWQHVALPEHAAHPRRTRSRWRGARWTRFYEEDDRILGHAADPYHRIDIRRTSRHLVVRAGDRVVADTTSPLVLYESGFAPRWYVPRDDVVARGAAPVDLQTFCPYKGIASYYDIDGVDARRVVLPRAVRRHGGDRRPRLLRARSRRGHAGRRAPRARARADRRLARRRPRT